MHGLSNGTNRDLPVTLGGFEGHFCCNEWQNWSRGPSATAELLILITTVRVYALLYVCVNACRPTELWFVGFY